MTGFLHRGVAAALLALCVAVSSASATTGDCDGNGTVAIQELITAVRISLGEAATADCEAADRNEDGLVSIDELVAAVREALGTGPAQQRAFVVTTNFTAGSYATVELTAPREVTPSSSARRIHRDAVVRTHDGLVYVLNRLFGDNLQALDPQDGFRTVFQCSTGNGTNPHDIAFLGGDKAYISLYEETTVLVVNPSPRPDCADFILGTIDLSSAADDDGIPDMDQMAIVGNRLYVALQRLDINNILRQPAEAGGIAVIDTDTDRHVDTIELIGENPFGAGKGLTIRGGKAYVATAGVFDVDDGGLERVDLTAQQSEGFIISEEVLGGDITDFVLVGAELGYAIVTGQEFTTALVAFDPSAGTRIGTVFESEGYNLFDIELNDRGELYLADRTRGNDGIRIFDAATGTQLTDDPIDLGLAPFEIVFLP